MAKKRHRTKIAGDLIRLKSEIKRLRQSRKKFVGDLRRGVSEMLADAHQAWAGESGESRMGKRRAERRKGK